MNAKLHEDSAGSDGGSRGQRQPAHPRAVFVQDDEAAVGERGGVVEENPTHLGREGRRHRIAHPQEHDAGALSAGGEEELLEVEVQSEDDMAVSPRPGEDNGVRCRRRSSLQCPASGGRAALRIPARKPSPGRGSCPRGHSRRLEFEFLLVDAQGGVLEAGVQVVVVEAWIRGEDFRARAPGSQQVQDVTDGDSQAANAGAARHHGGIDGDAIQFVHVREIYPGGQGKDAEIAEPLNRFQMVC